MENSNRYRSFFWPIVLIGIGAIWLMYNLGIIAGGNLSVIFRLWPLLLIAGGLDLIFGRRAPILGALFGLGLVALLLVLVLIGPQLGLSGSAQLTTENFSAPLNASTTAQINLEPSSGSINVDGQAGSGNLFEASVTHTGEMVFSESGEQSRTVELSGPRRGGDPFSWLTSMGQERWDVHLAPGIPLDFFFGISSGSADLNLSSLDLSAFTVHKSSGNTQASLPATGDHYPVEIEMSSGSLEMDVPENADVDFSIRISSGSLTIDIPDDAPARLEVHSKSSGNVDSPSRFQQVEGNQRGEGVWEAPGSSPGAPTIVISVDSMSSGTVRVR